MPNPTAEARREQASAAPFPIGLQASRDLASEATEACEALQLGAVGHGRLPLLN
jgi:hypothetical protein